MDRSMRALLPPTHASSLSPSSPSPSPSPPPTSTTTSTTLGPRPVVILPGLGNNTGDYRGLASALQARGVPSVVVARVSRLDWLRNAAGLLDANYWKGTLRPRPVLDWYLERVEAAVTEAKQQLLSQGGSLSLIGHSAGGWLARVYMEEFGTSHFSLLMTLGSPLLPPPKGLPGVIDQTRGLLDYVQKNCPPAVYTPELKYVCIAGRYIRGAPLAGNSNLNQDPIVLTDNDQDMTESPVINNIGGPTPGASIIHARFIGQGYKQVCGRADVWGDGVVPEMSAQLEGALNIILEGVYHSPVGSNDTQRPWYGSPEIVEKWVHHLLN